MTMEARAHRAILTPRGVLLGLVLAGLLFSSAYPMRRYFDVRASIRGLGAEERVVDARIAALEAERARLSSDAEVERLAREELAMVRPGEVPYVVVTPKPEPAPPAVVDPGGFEPPRPPSGPSLFERWWGTVARVARVAR